MRGRGVEKGKRESGVRRNTRSCQARWHTATHTQSLLVLHIPTCTYLSSFQPAHTGCRDLTDSAENKPPLPHLPESSAWGKDKQEHTISGQWSIFCGSHELIGAKCRYIIKCCNIGQVVRSEVYQ